CGGGGGEPAATGARVGAPRAAPGLRGEVGRRRRDRHTRTAGVAPTEGGGQSGGASRCKNQHGSPCPLSGPAAVPNRFMTTSECAGDNCRHDLGSENCSAQ